MSLETNLTIVKLILNDIRSGSKYNANDTKALRYIMSNIHNAALHRKLGIDKDVESPDFVYMSEEFKSQWDAVGSPIGADSLRKIGIHEHMIPFSVLVRRMIDECTDEQSIYDFIAENNKLVFVTKDEDGKLNKAGYQRVMPNDGDRYSAVGIKVHPEPVVFKNKAKHRKTK